MGFTISGINVIILDFFAYVCYNVTSLWNWEPSSVSERHEEDVSTDSLTTIKNRIIPGTNVPVFNIYVGFINPPRSGKSSFLGGFERGVVNLLEFLKHT